MLGSARASVMTVAVIVACAFASPSLALSIGFVPADASSIHAVDASTGRVASAGNAPFEGARSATVLVLPPKAAQGALPVVPVAAPPPSLRALVDAQVNVESPDIERECIATAVYFEARGEPVEGQLAVAQVVLNRIASGKYPKSACAVVKQPAQFSFVRRGKMPRIAKATEAWRKAVAIAHIAWERLAGQIGADVLWYHASYVSPGWGRRLKRVAQIGTHIFYN